MEVMNILFGDNDDTSGEEFGFEEPAEVLNVNGFQDTTHPNYSKFLTWARQQHNTAGTPIAQSPFKLYLLDCDAFVDQNSKSNGLGNSSSLSGVLREESPVFRLYGVDQHNQSVCCFVRGFKPYFYATPTNEFTADDIPIFQDSLNTAIRHEVKRKGNLQYLLQLMEATQPVVSVEIIQDPASEGILGYHPSKIVQQDLQCALKISCSVTVFIRIADQVLRQSKVTCPFVDDPCNYTVYEANFNPVVRFLTSRSISCCSWVEIQGPVFENASRQSYAQVEFSIGHDKIFALAEDVSVAMGIPKFRILSFDIECMVRPPEFVMPRQGNEQVIQISNVLRVYDDSDQSQVQVVFTLGTCNPLPNADVLSFETEESMLEAWRLFVVMTDPDIITGYNINKFDIPFLMDRAQRLGVKRFPYLGKLVKSPATYRSVRSFGRNKYIDPYADIIVPYIRGRVVFDMLPVMRQMFPEEASFKLAYISGRFLGCNKGDVHYSEIHELQTMDAESRQRLASYCLQDSWLVAELLLRKPVGDEGSKASVIQHYCEKAKSSGCPLRYVVSKNSKYDTYYKTVRKHKNPSLVFPPVTPVSRKRVASIPVPRLDKVRRALFQVKEKTGLVSLSDCTEIKAGANTSQAAVQ